MNTWRIYRIVDAAVTEASCLITHLLLSIVVVKQQRGMKVKKESLVKRRRSSINSPMKRAMPKRNSCGKRV